VKYMIIIYGNRDLWFAQPKDVLDELFAKFDAFNDKHLRTGELLSAYGVADPEHAKVVRVRDGMPAVTDGPYLESKEHLASWYLVEVPSEARALEIAAEVPAAALSQVEVWPIQHEGRVTA
jgi:hypothetical protein